MDQTKVLEYLTQHVMLEYLKRLAGTRFSKLVLFPVFPITASANLSDPHYLAILDDVGSLTKLSPAELN
jgi:hypothetical protein